MNVLHKRQGQVDVNFCYFYTDTIYQFRRLLADDTLKLEVIEVYRLVSSPTKKILIEV